MAAELEAHEGEVSEASVQAVFESVLAKFNLKLGQLAQPVRVALTGGTVSPGIYEVIAVLGKRRTVDRLNAAVSRIAQPASIITSHSTGGSTRICPFISG